MTPIMKATAMNVPRMVTWLVNRPCLKMDVSRVRQFQTFQNWHRMTHRYLRSEEAAGGHEHAARMQLRQRAHAPRRHALAVDGILLVCAVHPAVVQHKIGHKAARHGVRQPVVAHLKWRRQEVAFVNRESHAARRDTVVRVHQEVVQQAHERAAEARDEVCVHHAVQRHQALRGKVARLARHDARLAALIGE
jgi:hypothetical protein